ncbi:MAG: hypothetical protein M3042_09065 [Actinomycetota bacterium]|nr:hypothetical protein [Actinomycetota bacterium]
MADPAELWLGLDVEPIELCLPGGSGYTLRHYADGDEGPEPVFLGRDRRVFAFRSTEGLVAFLRGGEPHDLAGLPGWEAVPAASEIDVTPDDLGTYQLDMVVEMLRAGADSWDSELLVLAGEIARDVAKYAELPDVLGALAAGSPLDTLDDDLRDGGFLARRRLRKLDGDTLAIGWRSVISRVAAAVEFRD